jgi:competence protein ComEC
MKSTTGISKIVKKFLSKNIVNILFMGLALYILLSGAYLNSTIPEIIFFDIGQGDAILIQQENFQVLIDGGPDDSIVYELAQSMPLYDKNIEIMILTHPHEDHIRGLLNVLEEFSVEKILFNRVEYEQKAYEYLLSNYEDSLFEVVEGDTFSYGDIQGTVLFPFKDKVGQNKNINNESVVLLVEVKDYRILLMGDAEEELELKLLDRWDLQNIYILKVGHHCSKTSSSEMFLSVTKPQVAICSCGERNKFGHPHYETLEKFKMLNVQYLITYKEGNIVMKFENL